MVVVPAFSGNLLHNLILFGRLLRQLGMDVNPGRMLDAVSALEYINIGRKADFYHTLQTLLVNQRDDLPLFAQAFELFWKRPSEGGMDLNLYDLFQQPQKLQPLITLPSLNEEPEANPNETQDENEVQEVIELSRTYSQRELLYQKDFGNLTADELGEIRRLMGQLVWSLGMRRTRRQQPGDGRKLDFRQTLRHNFRYGGEPLRWSYLQPRIKPRPLVIIADVSGSMERYSRLLLHFLYSLAEGLTQRVEVFLFSTRLTRITRQLHHRDVDRAIQEVATAVPDWSGGTRIGEALKRFNFEWGRRVLRGGALVLLISDGWDRGDPKLLGQEMARLQRTCYRLVWLNPLLGSAEYEPLTRGMQAALPHIDDFLPAHNLSSLEQLANYLRQLDNPRISTKELPKAAFIGRKG